MKIYILISRSREYCGVFSSTEKAVEHAINRYCNRKRTKGRSAEFSRTEISESGKYIDVYFWDKEDGKEDEEWSPYIILIREPV